MPLLLPEYDSAYALFLDESVHEVAKASSPLLSGLTVEYTGGPVGSVVKDREGMDVDLGTKEVGFGFTLNVPAVRDGDLSNFLLQVGNASEELGKALVGGMVEVLDKVTDATGNVVKGQGEINFDVIYEALEKIEWSLDDDGSLIKPTMVMHPDMAEKLGDLPDLTEEQKEKLAALEARKREEAHARRRTRRIS